MINDKIIIDKLSKYKNIPWKFVDKEISFENTTIICDKKPFSPLFDR